MQAESNESVREFEFVREKNPSIWLEDNNGEAEPVLIPSWPSDYPERLAVFMTESDRYGVALNRDAMLKACQYFGAREDVIWFCNIPKDALLKATNADPSMF